MLQTVLGQFEEERNHYSMLVLDIAKTQHSKSSQTPKAVAFDL